ncbi:hypothetical protein V1460_06920 [Streptomyces sp. SCSIO 30461]|uniref:hypothetical protein n=1 Tax=Streptomyces sp. SCSIO 30461 TaxID=3118085 RepID=UPI0030CEC3BD
MTETVSNASASRFGRLLRAIAGLSVLLALVAYVFVRYESWETGTPGCVVRAAGGPDSGTDPDASFELTPEMAANAATISAVGTVRGMPERAVTIALATAMQESMLLNISYGDRDSLGLFQQRPSMGWGTTRQILDPVYSAGKFYEHLADVPGYSRLPLTEAAQRVQRSGYPRAYAKHEPGATLLAAALTGRAPAALTCTTGRQPGAGDPAKVRTELVRTFGEGVLPAVTGAGRAGARHTAGAGAELRVPVTVAPGGGSRAAAKARRGWELAHWAVAQADLLRITQVSYGGRVWNADEAYEGWQQVGRGVDGTGEVGIRVDQ